MSEVRIVNNTRVIQSRAIRQGIKARIALAAPTGYGKTWTALSMATELQGDKPVLMIDTERGSAALYGHDAGCSDTCTDRNHFTFEYLNWAPPYDPGELTRLLEEESGNYGVVIIDSWSHFWKGEGGTLDKVDEIAARQSGNQRNNTFSAWKQGNTVQDQMVDAILNAKCHVIVCMRSKMVYEQTKGADGKTKIEKLGLAPIQRDDVEFEFTVIAELDREHRMVITKSRCSLIADKIFPAFNERKMTRTLADWLDTAEAEKAPALEVTLAGAHDRILAALERMSKREVADLIIEHGWAKDGPRVTDWVNAADYDLTAALVARLRLPLALVEADGDDGDAADGHTDEEGAGEVQTADTATTSAEAPSDSGSEGSPGPPSAYKDEEDAGADPDPEPSTAGKETQAELPVAAS